MGKHAEWRRGKNRPSVASVRDAEFWSYNIIPACRGFANNEDEEGGKSFKIQMAKDDPSS